MPDLFGKKQLGRATTGGRFYATPTERVEAGAIYFPDESSLLFGVAEYTVEAGNLGAFATEGTFVFEKPDDWLDSLGRKVFFRPSTGEIVNQDKKGDVLIGFQIFTNVPDDKLGVVLTQGENSVVIIVTSTADSGAGSLRQAIAGASDGDVILFDADVFPVGQTTSILLSSYLQIKKSVSIYGGFSDGAGGYMSGAVKQYYVYRDVEGTRTKVVIASPEEAEDDETVLFTNVCRVSLDGQNTATCIGFSSGSSAVNISGVSIDNGLGANGGGASVANGGLNVLTDCAINDCAATTNGGGAYVASLSKIILNNCSFRTCAATSNGGGAVTINTVSQNNLNNCCFDACTAVNGGAFYFSSSSQNTLTDCVISGCSATSNGGGVHSTLNSNNTLNACIFDGCRSNNGGGLYSASTSQNTLNDCTFYDCVASNGGGVYSASSSQNVFARCSFTSCQTSADSTTGRGGAFYASSTTQNTFNDCVFSLCFGRYGGASAFYDNSVGVYNNCTFNSNTANNLGSAVYINGSSTAHGTATINNCEFTNNQVYVYSRAEMSCAATSFDELFLSGVSTVNITGGVTTAKTVTIVTPTITINDGAALTLTGTAAIGAATFTSAGRGYLATAAGIDISSATLSGIVACSYGAGLESFDISEDGATWTADDLTTPILLEEKGDGATWTTLSDDATGGSYSDSFEIGTTLRAFDGVRFFVASLDAYWQVEPFVVASNGGGGAGDASPSWTISDATITPNAEEV